ncbi:MAG: HlyD family efflux transporter periplasmic adaptor subunit [Ignavibacteriales bacterium]|nr:HlyD family efflux transporter periplasmic adaptor subunit [Ignavibacteriales bacterium]
MFQVPKIPFLQSPIVTKVLSLFKRRPIVSYSVLGVVLVCFVWYFSASGTTAKSDVLVAPTKGQFLVTVTTTGELQAKSSIDIKGSDNARAAGIWQMKISNIITEGTVVKKGDFVCEIDKSEIAQKLKDSQLSVQKLEAQFLQTKLDSALALSQARDELVNLFYAQEEKKIVMDQSAYEAPAMKRQAEIDYERAQRNFDQAKKNYVTKTQQAIAKAQAAEIDLMKEKQRLDIAMKTVMEFTIKAPADGMVIYAREWNGKKKVVGSQINSWDPTVATLPDLREMESITYVSEIDIQKIAIGQKVKLKLDADPNKALTGTITSVANIGEQRPNSDSKVFEVRVKVLEVDTTLRPSMTTANEILVAKLDDALFIPLECVHTEATTTFVFKKDGGSVVKQEVKLGQMNESAAVILAGITQKDQLYLSSPAEADKMTIVSLAVK